MQKETSFRLGFTIIATAWLVVWIPLLIVAITQPETLGGLGFILALAISTVALVGATGSVFYKNWAAQVYFVASIAFILHGVFGGPDGTDVSIPWGPILITGLFAMLWVAAKDQFT